MKDLHEEEGAESQAQEVKLCSPGEEAAAAADSAQLCRQKRTYMISVLHFVGMERTRVLAGGRTLLLIKANVPSSRLFWFLFAYYCVQVQVE